MRPLMMGLVLAGGLLAWTPGESRAQFSLTIGNPYYGSGIGIGNYGYYGGYNSFASPVYPGLVGGYNGFSTTGYVAGPGVFSYSSGYRGFAPAGVGLGYPLPARPYGYGYGVRPYYGNYGYRTYGNVPYRGFRPFRGANSWLWR